MITMKSKKACFTFFTNKKSNNHLHVPKERNSEKNYVRRLTIIYNPIKEGRILLPLAELRQHQKYCEELFYVSG